jgi:hypothetical protein
MCVGSVRLCESVAAAEVAAEVFGDERYAPMVQPKLAAEDFSAVRARAGRRTEDDRLSPSPSVPPRAPAGTER